MSLFYKPKHWVSALLCVYFSLFLSLVPAQADQSGVEYDVIRKISLPTEQNNHSSGFKPLTEAYAHQHFWILFFLAILVSPILVSYLMRLKKELGQTKIAASNAEIEWSHAVNMLDHSMVLLNLESEIIRTNDAFLKYVHQVREDVIGKKITEFFHDDGMPDNCPVCTARKDLKDLVINHNIDDPESHKQIPMQVSVRVVRDERDTPVGIIQEMVNLSKTREAEAKIRESEERFRGLVESTSDWIWETDSNGKFAYSSTQILDILGFKVHEVIGKKSFDFMHDDEVSRIINEHGKVLNEQLAFSTVEITMIHKNGRQVVLECSGVPFFNNHKEFLGYRGICHDVTNRKRSEEKFKGLLNATPDSLVIADMTGNIIFTNHMCDDLFGYEAGELIGKKIESLIPSGKRGKHKSVRINYSMNPSSRNMSESDNLYAEAKDGRIFPVDVSLSPINSAQGQLVTAAIRDISKRKEEERELRRLASFPEYSPLPIFEVGRSGQSTYVNPAAKKLFTGIDNKNSQHPVLKNIDSVFEQVSTSNEPILEAVEVEGSTYEQKVVYIRETDQVRVYSWDVTRMRKLAENVSHQAKHDALTGLLNRREFERRLTSTIVDAHVNLKESVLCYMDLDRFKVVNDTCGHVAGDVLLKDLSNLLKSKLRDSDSFARLGGDEFGLLLTNCSLEVGKKIAKTLKKAVNEFRFMWEEKAFNVGISIGLVTISEYSGTINEILKAADTACYVAKDKGRNRIFVYKSDDEEISRYTAEVNWSNRINEALVRDKFVLFAQELRSRNNSKKGHFELLVRMIGDSGEIIPPMAFIPAAERYNKMVYIDKWVIKKAAEEISAGSFGSSDIGINISGQSLSDPEFLDYVKKISEQHEINPYRVWFEITETAMVSNFSCAEIFIKELKKIGFRFALDDFGSGLSSFSYLKNLDVDCIKIDGSIVRDVANNPVSREMIESIKRIAGVMNIETVAEFVENKEIYSILKNSGVDYYQGYYIDRPGPITDKQFGTNIVQLKKKNI